MNEWHWNGRQRWTDKLSWRNWLKVVDRYMQKRYALLQFKWKCDKQASGVYKSFFIAVEARLSLLFEEIFRIFAKLSTRCCVYYVPNLIIWLCLCASLRNINFQFRFCNTWSCTDYYFLTLHLWLVLHNVISRIISMWARMVVIIWLFLLFDILHSQTTARQYTFYELDSQRVVKRTAAYESCEFWTVLCNFSNYMWDYHIDTSGEE